MADVKGLSGPIAEPRARGEEILTSHSGLHLLCHACRDPVAVITVPQGALLEVNRAFRELVRLPDPLPVGLTIMSLCGPAIGRTLRSWKGKAPRLVRKTVLGGTPGEARLLAIPATFPVQAFFHFMPGRGSTPVEAGRLKELLDERLQQIRNLERLGSLGEIAAVIIHEIRVPLSTIRLGLELARKGSKGDGGVERRLDFVLEQVERLERLLQSIRSFAHPRGLAPRWVDLREIITRALRAVEASIRGPAMSVAVQVRPDPLRILADAEALAEAIQNVVMNAVEAMPKGGVISVVAGASPDRPGSVDLAVSDQGVGIPPDLLGRMFQPFFTTKKTGTGLGLSIVKRIAELHGGAVWLRSAPGRGTTVVIQLPGGSK